MRSIVHSQLTLSDHRRASPHPHGDVEAKGDRFWSPQRPTDAPPRLVMTVDHHRRFLQERAPDQVVPRPPQPDSSSTENSVQRHLRGVMFGSQCSPVSSQGRDGLRHLAGDGEACPPCDLLRNERHDHGSPCRRLRQRSAGVCSRSTSSEILLSDPDHEAGGRCGKPLSVCPARFSKPLVDASCASTAAAPSIGRSVTAKGVTAPEVWIPAAPEPPDRLATPIRADRALPEFKRSLGECAYVRVRPASTRRDARKTRRIAIRCGLGSILTRGV